MGMGALRESVLEKNEFKRKFSLLELYRSLVYVPRAVRRMKANGRTRLVDQGFLQRIQLVVTEVNGCAACSYNHTQMALEQGMSNEEISSLLSGADASIRTEEAKAVMFAQHFADQKGRPQRTTYQALEQEYGKEEARIILAAAQVMIAGNMYGIPFSAFLSRRQGKPYKGSSLWYELSMLVFGVLFIPVAMLHAFLRWLVGLPNIRFGRARSA